MSSGSSISSSSTDSHQALSTKCFLKWMDLQEHDLGELLQALNIKHQKPENLPNQLIEKSIQRFQDYMEERKNLAMNSAYSYFVPRWMSTLEKSLLWIAGCRPSMFIRLLYALCGSEVEKNLSAFIQSGVREGNLGGLSSNQLNLVNGLHQKTVKQEDLLSSNLASIQEDFADEPIVTIAKNQKEKVCPVHEELKKALDEHNQSMLKILEEADELRLDTLKELISILTPYQALHYLAAAKKIHLYLHRCGKIMDHIGD